MVRIGSTVLCAPKVGPCSLLLLLLYWAMKTWNGLRQDNMHSGKCGLRWLQTTFWAGYGLCGGIIPALRGPRKCCPSCWRRGPHPMQLIARQPRENYHHLSLDSSVCLLPRQCYITSRLLLLCYCLWDSLCILLIRSLDLTCHVSCMWTTDGLMLPVSIITYLGVIS